MSGVCCSNNKDIILEAFEMLFNKRDYTSAESFWSPDYIQHSAYVPAGRGGLFDFTRSLPAMLRYENALATTEGDYVILHGRFSGQGLARSWTVADVVRLQNGVLVEHWDVIQNKATESESKSGRPMFGRTFPPVAPSSVVSTNTQQMMAHRIIGGLMNDLLQTAVKAHSGLKGWNRVKAIKVAASARCCSDAIRINSQARPTALQRLADFASVLPPRGKGSSLHRLAVRA
jgi:predicted SnoaL-like aldol condensation-catalyzing enzyme